MAWRCACSMFRCPQEPGSERLRVRSEHLGLRRCTRLANWSARPRRSSATRSRRVQRRQRNGAAPKARSTGLARHLGAARPCVHGKPDASRGVKSIDASLPSGGGASPQKATSRCITVIRPGNERPGIPARQWPPSACGDRVSCLAMSSSRRWSFAVEFLPKGIRVNAVSPDPRETPALAKVWRDKDMAQQPVAQMTEAVPMKRFGKSGEWWSMDHSRLRLIAHSIAE